MIISHAVRNAISPAIIFVILMPLLFIAGCTSDGNTPPDVREVPGQEGWGIYELDRSTLDVKLLYGSSYEIFTSCLGLSSSGDRLVFAQKIGGQDNDNMEICSIGTDGGDFTRITNNRFWDLYPVWSPDDTRLAFLSMRENDLDIYVIDADGGNEHKLFDSGFHDADIDWVGDSIVFTSQSAIWRMNPDGTQPVEITSPPGRGEWGIANLPLGDYDPRLSPDGGRIVFERLDDVNQPNGIYNIYVINRDGSGETRLTDTGYAQGLVNWSHSGRELVYIVGAINGEGKYDIYIMNSDGTGNHNITPDYFPADFLCRAALFSQDDSKILFIGQWWE